MCIVNSEARENFASQMAQSVVKLVDKAVELAGNSETSETAETLLGAAIDFADIGASVLGAPEDDCCCCCLIEEEEKLDENQEKD